MAEVVGVVVGVVSLGVQLAESLQKVKRYYDTVRDAPARLADIIDEIGSLSDILTELEQDLTPSGGNTGPTMQRCVAVCRKAVDRFASLADSLESRMKRSKGRGSVRFAMKNESIESVIASLESSKSNLVLAYMLYREAIADKRARLVQEQMNLFARGQALLLQQHETAKDTRLTAGKSPERQSHHRRSQPRLKTPAWLSHTIWEMGVDRAISGWTFSLRSYSLMSYKSPMVDAYISGNVALVQRSFDMREASPFDEVVFITTHRSLLDIAVTFNQVEVSRLLVRYGNTSLNIHALLGANELFLREGPSREDLSVQRDWFHFLFEHCEIERGHCDAAEFATLHAFVYGSTEESTAAFFWMAGGGIYWRSRQTVSVFDLGIVVLEGDTSFLLEFGNLDDAIKIERLALGYAFNTTDDVSNSASNMRMLGRLVAEAVNLGYDLHDSAAADGISPLLRILRYEYTKPSAERMEARLHAWLALLKSIGVDLHTYGQEEWNRFQALRRDCERPWDRWHGVGPHRCKDQSYRSRGSFHHNLDNKSTLSAFSYGSDVSDWKLWILHPGDQYAGQFWRLVEQNGIFDRHVPGGWIETD